LQYVSGLISRHISRALAKVIMSKYAGYILLALTFLLSGCGEEENKNELRVATCADYPPFEYYQNGERLVGFDVELMEAIAQKLKKKVVFKDMAFGSILSSVENGAVDVAVAAMNPSEEKRKNFDFSNEYCKSSISVIHRRNNPITDITKISSKKVVCQLGCLKHKQIIEENAPQAEIILTDKVDAAVESLKAGLVDYVVADTVSAQEFRKENPDLASLSIGKCDEGYAILIKKGSPLKDEIDKALDELKFEGKIKELEEKYLNK
jgi:polar amino acid transport system substrate-binding protein